ncbi:MAG: endonuclease V [Thermoleophilia bacterium]|nr:endonuclease V [Thermoleophilia bacterium]
MDIPDRHRWDLRPDEAVALQRVLAEEVDTTRPLPAWSTLAAADLAFNRYDPRLCASVIVFAAESLEVLEAVDVERTASFPYVPGLLSFREIPPILDAFRQLKTVPDVVLCDGQGVAHPRKLGLATHLGLWLGLPTVGCAKSRLCGEYEEPGPSRGDRSELTVGGEFRGYVLRTRDKVAPLFVSPGHLCDAEGAARLVLATTRGRRLPEPARMAHERVNGVRRRAGPRPPDRA